MFGFQPLAAGPLASGPSGDAAPPADPLGGPISLLAFWLGGAAAPVVAQQGGFVSFKAFWLGGAAAPVAAPAAGQPPPAGGAFTRRPDRLPGRRLNREDLQEYFTSEQDALRRAEKAKGKREREALEVAAQAVSRAMRAAVGQDEAIEPDIADIARKLRAAATAKRVTHAIRLANEAAVMARRIGYEIEHGAQIRLDEDDEEAAFLLF